jgi:DNA polymerase
MRDAQAMYEWTLAQKRNTYDLSPTTWMVCESLKMLWRDANPHIVGLWERLENAARCIVNDGIVTQINRVVFDRQKSWLRIRLPSSRYLCYPHINTYGGISYSGINTYSRKWERIKTYGGKLAENITQAVSRDILASAMTRSEMLGFETVLTVHDEIITETPDNDGYNAKQLAGIMACNPRWAEDLPLAAAGFEAYRYRKE